MAESDTTRRGFIGLLVLGYSGLALWVGGIAVSFLKFLFPNAIYEAPQKFKVDGPDDYPLGSITLILGRKVWIGHYEEGFAAIIAVCTHLGCKPNWHPERSHEVFGHGLFECPCHGSKFDRYARNFAGPAPYPLYRATLTLGPDDRLFVDKTIKLKPKVRMVEGLEVDETKAPEFFLSL
ncbi:ubiquinol-cytochrome c reductase iron-sulfur subunit [bacterium]|nr:ubiquinol-cytochrome c reductase iron-sulfur subunit [bacterium]